MLRVRGPLHPVLRRSKGVLQNAIGVEGLCLYVGGEEGGRGERGREGEGGRGKREEGGGRESTFTCLHPGCCHDNRRVEECKLHGMFVVTLELPLENIQTTFH